MSIIVLLAMPGCRPHAGPHEDVYLVPPLPASSRSPLVGYEAHFEISWNGARIGDASEYLRLERGDKMRFERRERITVRRGDALAHSETDIGIALDRNFRAQRVTLHSIASGMMRTGVAQRTQHGDWSIVFGDEAERRVPGHAVPAEIVPLMLAHAERNSDDEFIEPRSQTDRAAKIRFDGPVLLAGFGFAVADLRVEEEVPGRLLVTLSTPEGALRSRFVLAQSGTISRIQGEGGVGARRVDAATLSTPFMPPEIVDAASVAVTGMEIVDPLSDIAFAGDYHDPSSVHLSLYGIPADRALPPPLPGQSLRRAGDSWQVLLQTGDECAPPALASAPIVPMPARSTESSPALRQRPDSADITALAAQITAEPGMDGSRREEIYALARATADLLDDDLGTPEGGARAALLLGRGDCTAHALLFAALAEARGIATRLVTGYRLVGNRMIRHRWALAALDGHWLAVDPTYGEAPTSARLLGLATHGTRASELALADEIAFAGLGLMRAHAAREPELSGPQCVPTRPRIP